MTCPDCGADTTAHDCHCLTVDGLRVAVGVCCGRELGASLLAEEDYHDGAPWAREEDCTCSE